MGSKIYEDYFSILEHMATGAQLVMVFSSRYYINDIGRMQPIQSMGQLEDIVKRLRTAFLK